MEHEKKGNFRSESVYSKKIRAGKRRTYFFDVKSTRSSDYFLTITESKKRMDDTYDRFKIFVYKEDLNKFLETLSETIDHIKKELMPDYDFDAYKHSPEGTEYNSAYTNEGVPEIESQPTPPSAPEVVANTESITNDSPATTPPPTITNDDDLKW